MKKELNYINLLSDNNKELIKFYTDTVGLEPTDTEIDPTENNWYGFETGSVKFAIEPKSNRDKYKFEGYNKNNPYLIQFKIDNLKELEEVSEKLELAEVPIGQKVLKKSYGTVTTFIDPDGNLVELLFEGE